jgi:predicted phage terminase large subunit-like protein
MRAKKIQAERSLKSFIEQAWHVLEPPTRPFVPNWHIDVICEHLEAVTNGDIQWLLFNVPPGHMKSMSVGVFWHAWEWGPKAMPWTRWLTFSYSGALSMRDSIRAKRVMDSDWYQANWHDRFNWTAEAMTKYENDATGYRLSSSVGGLATGERGDRIIIDDPHNVKDAVKSEANRQDVQLWWDESMPTRYVDAEKSARVIIMQRIHEQDLSGHILENESEADITHVMLPGEYEADRKWSMPSRIQDMRKWSHTEDPRETDGAPLYPQRFSVKELARLKRRLGSYGFAGQIQQRPAPRAGGMVQTEWFERYRVLPIDAHILRVIQSWDTANGSNPEADYSVMGLWLETTTMLYLAEVYRERLNHPDLLRTVRSKADQGWNGRAVDALLIENKASGTSIIQHIRSETKLPVIDINPEGDKVTRMSVESPFIEAGNVALPENAPWLSDYEQEIRNFPNSANKDQVDMTSQTIKWVRSDSTGPRIW